MDLKKETHILNLNLLEKRGNFKSSQELADAIGISRSALFSYKKKKRIPRVVDFACCYLLYVLEIKNGEY